MKNAFRLRPSAIARILLLLCALNGLRPNARAVASADASLSAQQQFFCSMGYDSAKCRLHAAALKAVLLQYPAPQLGPWSWVIVRSEDWQPLVRRLRLDQRSPAFTSLDQRSTYLDEALFHPQPKRASELEGIFHLTIEQLLPIAVSHELGHAVCHEMDEGAAERIAQQLRNGEPIDCQKAHGLSPIQQLSLHRRSPGLK